MASAGNFRRVVKRVNGGILMQRVALIGAGGMGNTHIASYSMMSRVQLVAVVDSEIDKAAELAETYSVESYSSMEDMLATCDVDVVDICTPTPSHFDLIAIAASAGKHVICEKPLARSVSQAQEAVHLCEEAGVRLFPAQVLRWFHAFRKLHDMLEEGVVGKPIIVRTTRGGGPPKPGSWFNDYKQSGGVAFDLIIHDYDWLRWCFGRVKRVYAKGLYEAGLPIDYALVTLRFESGVIAHVEGNWAGQSLFRAGVEVAGDNGLIDFMNIDSNALSVTLRQENGTETTYFESPTAKNPYYLELEHFINCLETGTDSEVTAEDGLEAVRIAEAAVRSICTGEPVAIA